MQTLTQTELKDRFGHAVPQHIIDSVEVPLLNGLQIQGDVAFIPQVRSAAVGIPVPSKGVALVSGESTGNTHLLMPGVGVTWRPLENSLDNLGVIDVETEAFVHHNEHGYIGLSAGSYLVRGQTQMLDELERVAD